MDTPIITLQQNISSKWTEEVKAQVITARLAGKSIRQVARETGVPKSTISAWEHRQTPVGVRQAPAYGDDFRDAILSELDKGRTIRSVAKEFNVAKSTIAVWFVGRREVNELEPQRSGWSKDIPTGKLDSRDRYVYLIREAWRNFVKIGIASDLYARVAAMQACCPQELTVVGYFVTAHARTFEAYLHNRFSQKLHSGEWFELSSEDIRLVMDCHDGFVSLEG